MFQNLKNIKEEVAVEAAVGGAGIGVEQIICDWSEGQRSVAAC